MKKDFATPIDSDLLEKFKKKCKENGFKMNEIIEVYMDDFVNGNINVVKEIRYKLEKDGGKI